MLQAHERQRTHRSEAEEQARICWSDSYSRLQGKAGRASQYSVAQIHSALHFFTYKRESKFTGQALASCRSQITCTQFQTSKDGQFRKEKAEKDKYVSISHLHRRGNVIDLGRNMRAQSIQCRNTLPEISSLRPFPPVQRKVERNGDGWLRIESTEKHVNKKQPPSVS